MSKLIETCSLDSSEIHRLIVCQNLCMMLYFLQPLGLAIGVVYMGEGKQETRKHLLALLPSPSLARCVLLTTLVQLKC